MLLLFTALLFQIQNPEIEQKFSIPGVIIFSTILNVFIDKASDLTGKPNSNMKFEFETSGGFIDLDESIVIVSLPSDDGDHYFVVQKALDIPDAGYHIERDDQSYGTYGGVVSATLSPTELHVVLDEIGKKALKVEEVRLKLSMEKADYEEVKEGLRIALGNLLKVK